MWIGRRRERMPNIRMGVCKSMGMEELGIGLRGCWFGAGQRSCSSLDRFIIHS
jgi:hypothetical protein